MEHELDHCDTYHGFASVGEILVVFAEASVAAQPTERSFHDPAMGEDMESLQVIGSANDLEDPATDVGNPSDQLAGIPAIGPDQLDSREKRPYFLQQQLGPVAILDVGRMHHHPEQQPYGIYEDMPLAAVDLLAGVVAVRPPFSVVLTDWLSMIAALGCSSRPARFRTWQRRVS